MTDHQQRIQAAFRLNLEQQKKRAKDLLKAARAGSSSALSRIAALDHGGSEGPAGPELKLADAQSVIARELGFSSWPELKIHIASMDRERKLVGASAQPLDAGPKTLHLRCGSDIRPTLLEAGFKGDFLEVSYPYCHGPVTASPDHLEQEARFIAEFAGKHMKVSFAGALASGMRRNARWRHPPEITSASSCGWSTTASISWCCCGAWHTTVCHGSAAAPCHRAYAESVRSGVDKTPGRRGLARRIDHH